MFPSTTLTSMSSCGGNGFNSKKKDMLFHKFADCKFQNKNRFGVIVPLAEMLCEGTIRVTPGGLCSFGLNQKK